MQSLSTLERYMYLGNLIPVFVPKPHKYDIMTTRSIITELVLECDADLFLGVVRKCLIAHKCLPRNNEVWFVYAVYLDAVRSDDNRNKAQREFSRLALTTEDLFLFAKSCFLLQEADRRKGLSRTARKAINQWYTKQSGVDLVEMLGVNRGLHGITHKDLICLCHVNFTKLGYPEIINGFFKRCIKAIEDNNLTPDITPTLVRMNEIFSFKICTDVETAKEMMRRSGLQIDNTPMCILRKPEIWEVLVPTLSYRQLINYVFTLIDTKVFSNRNISKIFVKAIGDHELMKNERDLHPIVMFILLKKLITSQRYSERVKAGLYAAKLERLHIKIHPSLIREVGKTFKTSLHKCPPIGIRIFITINLQESYSKKPVSSKRQIACTDAAVMLAYSYFRSEKRVAVYTFTPTNTQLKQIHWSRDNGFDNALEICKAVQTPRNCQRIFMPIREASKQIEPYDLFLTIVPSAARGNPGNKPDKLIRDLNEYRKKKNKNARVVILNLRRFKPALIHKELPSDDGILEICGFDEYTPKLINAFAQKLFN